MQSQNVLLQTFIRDLVTNGVRACDSFLPRDATQSAVMPQYVVRLSVCYRSENHAIPLKTSIRIYRNLQPHCAVLPSIARHPVLNWHGASPAAWLIDWLFDWLPPIQSFTSFSHFSKIKTDFGSRAFKSGILYLLVSLSPSLDSFKHRLKTHYFASP